MTKALEEVLTALEPTALTICTPQEWEDVKAEVLRAGVVSKASPTAQLILKAAKRQFGSRSEAGRYAASIRWSQARGEGAGAGGATPSTGEAVGNTATPNTSTSQIIANYETKYGGPEYKAKLKEAKVYDLADEVRSHLKEQGKKVPPSAKPYLDAMDSLDSVNDSYGFDSGKSVVAYAISNLKFYGTRGKAIKAELNSRIK